jgi:hypothetical protein
MALGRVWPRPQPAGTASCHMAWVAHGAARRSVRAAVTGLRMPMVAWLPMVSRMTRS